MKTVATFEEGFPVKVERFHGDLKIGERKAEYHDFIESLAQELPVLTLLSTLLSKKSDLKEYLDKVTNDDISLFEEFFDVLCSELYSGLFKDLPYWSVILNKLSIYQSTLDLNTQQGLDILQRSLAIFGEQNSLKDDALFPLFNVLMRRLSKTEKDWLQYSVGQLLLEQINTATGTELKKKIESIVRKMDAQWVQEMFRKVNQSKNLNGLIASSGIPKNCVWIQHHEHSTKYVIEIPKAQFRVKFQDVPFENAGHPRMLFIFEIGANETIINLKLVCAKDEAEITLDTPLYSYPYSNVFGNGSVCWNGYKDLKIPYIQVANMFLSTSNNSHLQKDVLERFKANENKPFDDQVLEPLMQGATLKDVL